MEGCEITTLGPDHGRKPHPQSWAGGLEKFMRMKSSCGCASTMVCDLLGMKGLKVLLTIALPVLVSQLATLTLRV
jgi:hypothetical protein